MRGLILGGVALACFVPNLVLASEPDAPPPALTWSAEYTVDVMGTVSGGLNRATRTLDNASLTGSLNLEALAGWRGAMLNAHVLHNSGGRPNDDAGTLDGVNNIEVADGRTKLFELYLDQQLGSGGLLRLGWFDLNASFYATDASGLLVNPAFGIGGELAATGVNGPSIFPSTAFGVMGETKLTDSGYVRLAAYDSVASNWGDPGGFRADFDEGALIIGEVGWTGDQRVALGVWTYTDRQPDLVALGPDGGPLQRRSAGAYVLAEVPLGSHSDGERASTAFFRFGVSDGRTTDFAATSQLGWLTTQVFAARPESQFSAGLRLVRLSRGARDAIIADGGRTGGYEAGLEVTYADALTPWLSVQPTLQVTLDPGGNREIDPAWLAGIRMGVAFGN